jgi:DNA helicase-2/ATP-dependent DNA helicase PcrA
LLSADWQTLDADEVDWEKKFVDPAFLGAWQKHRQIYGYTLRSELVYQLKRALERIGTFQFDSNYSYLLVDEYQDLNRCDLAIISKFSERGGLVYCAGDDDQSIYGFRFAHPEGIRRFDKEFTPCKPLSLKTCIRCDKKIIDLAVFIAKLDPSRIDKPLKPRPDAGDGEVVILRFDNQDQEANGVSLICQYLINNRGYQPNDIMILMRGDRHGIFSKSIRDKLLSKDIPVKIQEDDTPLDQNYGRLLLAVIRLLANPSDNLSFRTIFMLKKGIGEQSIFSIYNLAKEKGVNFITAAQSICEKPETIPKTGKKICDAIKEIVELYSKFAGQAEEVRNNPDQGKLIVFLVSLAENIIPDLEKRKEIVDFLIKLISETEATTLKELFIGLSSLNQTIEQELALDEINIMTMHKAKGLTSKAVIIVACEDEYIPGKQEGEAQEGDERRLLYVSLSRARHFLAITYCENRTGSQAHTGRTAGESARNLTRFLRDAPVSPLDGNRYIAAILRK